MREFLIYCTDEGQHARVKLRRLRFDGENVTEVLSLIRQTGFGGGFLDGEPVSGRTVGKLDPSVTIYDGQEQWAWPCPRCGADARMSGANLRAWMRNTQESGLDVSLLRKA